MGLKFFSFGSKKKQGVIDTTFSQEQKISNGNLFEIAQKLRAQKEIDLRNYAQKIGADSEIISMIDNQTLNAYWLLELQWIATYLASAGIV